MEIDNNEALHNLLSAISSIERHYFKNILNGAPHREDFSIQKCNCCPNTEKFPFCFATTDPPYLNCYLHSLRTYLNVKYKLNWLTVTLFPPSVEDKIDNYNLGYDIENIKKFYSYFDGINYSASKAIFIDRHSEISEIFPSTDIFKMHYIFETGLIEITDAINHSIVLPEQPSEDNFKKYINIMSSVSGKKLNYLYFFIYKNFNPLKEKELFSGLYIPSDTEIIASYLKEISILTKIFLTPIEKTRSIILLNDEYKKKIRFSMKAASAAIMSRNGSHNIGSHVLSSVSQNFHEWTDNKFLFSYIQQRMDFIAQITTEVPEWHYPSLFIQDLMRRFYMQRHILNYICSAESLSAYEYQKRENNKYISLIYDATIKNKVIINIVKNGKPIISPEYNDNVNSLTDVIQVAIPGGIIGQHAFYTILENILRNAAKHNWSRNENNPNNLELTIDYEDRKDKDYVLVKIWDNISNIFKETKESLSPEVMEEQSKRLLNNANSKNTYLHQSINAKLKKHFIDIQTGKLLNENWGLAEIKICAAYLNKKDISEVGINEENILFDSINDIGFISTVGHEDKGIYRLCYQFPIPKPKELLICGVAPELLNHNKQSEVLSVHFAIEVPSRIDYELIVFTNPQDVCNKYSDIYEKELFPFRLVLISSEIPDSCLSLIENLIIKRRLVLVKEDIKTYLEKYNIDGNKYDWDGLKLNVYVDWLNKYFTNKLIADKPLSLFVELKAASNEGEQQTGLESFLKSLKINNSYNEIIKDILIKDEECIESMPVIFKAKDKVENGKHDKKAKQIFIVDELRSEVKKLCNYSSNEDMSDIIIKRHCSSIDSSDKFIYQEALSGAQIYFNLYNSSLSNYFQNKFTLMLIENALLNIRVADERFAKYYLNYGPHRERFTQGGKIYPTFKFKYKNIPEKILVSDEDIKKYNDAQDSYIFDYDQEKYRELDVDFNLNNSCDVLIIHQTLLDEYYDNNKKEMEEFIGDLKAKGMNVIVTSGRGKPDKLAANAKFLPFSNMESSLFKSYPEKILLTQAIMSIHRKMEMTNEL